MFKAKAVQLFNVLMFVILIFAYTVMVSGEEEVIGGVGPIPGWLFLDLSSLNEVLEAQDYGPLPNAMLLLGGGGLGGKIAGWSLGGRGVGGSVSSEKSDKKAELFLGYGGFLAEYELVAKEKERYAFSLGGLVGWGGATLFLLDHRSASFEDAIINPPNTSLSRFFLAVQPYASLDLPLMGFMILRASAGYLWTILVNPWEQDGNSLPGPPANFNAPILQFQILFGKFSAWRT